MSLNKDFIFEKNNEILIPKVEFSDIGFFLKQRKLAFDFFVKLDHFFQGIIELHYIEVILIVVSEENGSLTSHSFSLFINFVEKDVYLKQAILRIEIETFKSAGILSLFLAVIFNF